MADEASYTRSADDAQADPVENDYSGLTKTERALLEALKSGDFCGDGCSWSQALLAGHVGKTREHVNRCLRNLERRGLVVVERNGRRKDGRCNPNTYRVRDWCPPHRKRTLVEIRRARIAWHLAETQRRERRESRRIERARSAKCHTDRTAGALRAQTVVAQTFGRGSSVDVLPPSKALDERKTIVEFGENRPAGENPPQQQPCEQCERYRAVIDSLTASEAQLVEDVAALEAKVKQGARNERALLRRLNDAREADPLADDIRDVCEYWRERCNHPDAQTPLTGKRAENVRSRLREKFTVDRLKRAIDGAAAFPYVVDSRRVAEGPKHKRYDDLELICRDETQVEKFERLAERAEQQEPAPQPQPRARTGTGGPPAIDRILERLEGVKPERRGQWTARCPVAHNHKREDRNASLSVGMGHKGVVVHCHTGCQPDEIAAALGVPESEWFDEQPTPIAQRPASRPVDPLPTDEQLKAWQGTLANSPRLLDRLREVKGWTPGVLAALGVGWDGERLVFPIRNPDGSLATVTRYLPNRNPKMLGLRGRDRGLFPAPETLAPGEVWVVEGEPDAITGHMLGLPCVGVPGANGWRQEWAERFRGRPVTVCADCDQPGRELAKRVAASLDGVTTVAVVDLAADRSDGFDLTDWVRAGGTVAELRELAAAVRQAQMRLANCEG